MRTTALFGWLWILIPLAAGLVFLVLEAGVLCWAQCSATFIQHLLLACNQWGRFRCGSNCRSYMPAVCHACCCAACSLFSAVSAAWWPVLTIRYLACRSHAWGFGQLLLHDTRDDAIPWGCCAAGRHAAPADMDQLLVCRTCLTVHVLAFVHGVVLGNEYF